MVYKKAFLLKARVLLSFVLVFSLSFPFPITSVSACDSSQVSRDADYIQKGKDYYNRGKLIEARAMFELALKSDPENKWAKYYINKIDSKIGSLSNTSVRRPAKVERLYKEGKEAFLSGNYSEAARLFSKVLEYVPTHQYAKRYLEKSNERLLSSIDIPQQEGVSSYTFDKDIDATDDTDPDVLKTRLRLALLTLQKEMSDYLGMMKGMEEGQKALMRKYLAEKQKQINMLKEKIDQQKGLVDSLSLERLKLQTQLARINEEISILQSRLMMSFSGQGYDVESMDLEDLLRQEAVLTAEEEALRQKLQEELSKRAELQKQLSVIEDKIRGVQPTKSGEKVVVIRQPEEKTETNNLAPSKETTYTVQLPNRAYTREDISRVYKEAVSMYKDGLYKEAIEAFKSLIKIAPVDSRYVSRARDYILKCREAIRKRQILLKSADNKFNDSSAQLSNSSISRSTVNVKDVDYLASRLKEVMDLLDEDKFAEAESLLIKLRAMYPNDSRVSRLLKDARSLQAEKEYNEALETVREKISRGEFEQAKNMTVSLMDAYPSQRKGLSAMLKEINRLIDRQKFLMSVHEKTISAVDQQVKAMPERYKDKLGADVLDKVAQEQAEIRDSYYKAQLSKARRLMREKNFDEAESILKGEWEGDYIAAAQRLLEHLQTQKEAYLAEENRRKQYSNLISQIEQALDKEDFGLATQKARLLQKQFPERRSDVSSVIYRINRAEFLAKYRDILSLLQTMGHDEEKLKKANALFATLDKKYSQNREYSELASKIKKAQMDLENWRKSVAVARERMLKGVQNEMRKNFKKAWVDPAFMNVVRKEQEERRDEYLKAVLAKAQEMMESWYSWPIAKELLHELLESPYRATAKRLLLELNKKETERDFHKEIAAVRAAIKVYDFETAREALGRADALIPRHPLIKDLRRQLKEKEKWYKVQQALKTAQDALKRGDFVGARVILDDVIKNIDPHSIIAKRMLGQVDRAEANYYANLKLKEGLAALKAGDYQSAIQIAEEGLKWNRYDKDLRSLQRRAKSRWQSEILRRKNLLNQIEEDARKRHSMYMAYSESETAKLDFDHKRMLLEADVRSLLNQATRLLNEQKYDRAIALCNKILEYEPGNLEAKKLLDLIAFTKENEAKRMKVSLRNQNSRDKTTVPVIEEKKKNILNQTQSNIEEKNKAKKLVLNSIKKNQPVMEKQGAKEIAQKSSMSGEERLAMIEKKKEQARHNAFIRKVNSFIKKKVVREAKIDRLAMANYHREVVLKAKQQTNNMVKDAIDRANSLLAENKFEEAKQALAYAQSIASKDRKIKMVLRKIGNAERKLALARKRKSQKIAMARQRTLNGLDKAIMDKKNHIIKQDAALKQAIEKELIERNVVQQRAIDQENMRLAKIRKKTLSGANRFVRAKKERFLSGDKDILSHVDSELKRRAILQQRDINEENMRLAKAREKTIINADKFVKNKAISVISSTSGLAKDVATEVSMMAIAQLRNEVDSQMNALKDAIANRDLNRAKKLYALIAQKNGLSREQLRLFNNYGRKIDALERDIELDKETYLAEIKNRLKKLKLAEAQDTTDAMSKTELVKNLLSDAQTAVLDGNYQKVLRTTEKVLEIDPENEKALSLAERARLMIKLQSKLAEREAKAREKRLRRIKAKKQKATNKEDKSEAKKAVVSKAKKEKAFEKKEKVEEAKPETEIESLYMKAKSLYNEGALATSKEIFEDVINREKQAGVQNYSIFAKQYMDLIRERQKDIAAAKKATETEELVDNVIDKLFEDAKSLARKGKYAAAASIYENILFLDPANKFAQDKLFAMKEKIYQKAKQDIESKIDDQDKAMLKQVMDENIEDIDLKKKYLSKQRRKKIIKVPEIKKKLQKRISANFEDVPLVDILKFFADQVSINIIPSASVLSQNYTTSIEFKDMTLENALKYLLKSFGLVYQIDEEAIWITTPDEMEKEPMETKVYHLDKGIGLYSKFSTSSSGSVELGSGAQVSEVKTLKDILDEAVDWPSGSKIVLDERTGTLIVTNSPMNIKKIDDILWNLDVVPLQVLIEAKFLEVDVTDLKELGVEWKVANEDWGVNNKGSNFAHGVAANSGVNFSDFSNASEGLNLTYKGVLTKPQYEAVVHALEQNQNTRTLSSPRIATMNNQAASIKVVDEWIYPTRYEFQVVQYDLNGDGDYDDAGETKYENVPMDFVKRDVGIILTVTPSVGDDMETISLSLIPEVSDAVADYFKYTGGVSLPKFTSRNLSTNIVVDNTDTVVLGGLIKESRTNTTTKVPLLGDLPVLGNLFKKKADTVNRKNLLIFVTASIIDSQGDAIVVSGKK